MLALFSADPAIHTRRPAAAPSSLRRLGGWCWAFRRLLGVGAGAGVLLGLLLALLKPVTYTASATLVFPAAPLSRLSPLPAGGDLPSLPLLDGELLVPQPGSSAATASLLVQSHRLRDDLIARLQLRRQWQLRTLRAARLRYADHLLCRLGSDGELEVGFQDTDASRAFQVAGALQAALTAAITELGRTAAERNLSALQQEADDVAGQLQRARRQLQAFQDQHHLTDVPEQTKALTDQYISIQTQSATERIEAEAAARQLGTLQSKARALVEQSMEPAALTATSPTSPLASLYRQLTELEFTLADLRSRFTEDYPDVQVKRTQLAIVQAQLQHELSRQSTLVDSGSAPLLLDSAARLVEARAKADGYARLAQHLAQQVDQLPAQVSAYSRLSADVEMASAADKLYHEELERARMIAASRAPVFTVVDPVAWPDDHDPTGRGLLIALLGLFGLGAAALAPYAHWRAEGAAAP